MTNETKSALEQLRERLQGHARVQVCTLEAKDCAELVLLVDRALAGLTENVAAASLTHKTAGCACGGDAPWPSGPHEPAMAVSLEPIVRRNRLIDQLSEKIRFAEWGGRTDANACPWCNNPSEHKVHAVLCPMFNGKGEIR